MALVDDQEPVEAFAANGANRTLGIAFAFSARAGGADHPHFRLWKTSSKEAVRFKLR